MKELFKKYAGRVPETDRPYSQWEPQPPPPPKIVKLITRKPLVAGRCSVLLRRRIFGRRWCGSLLGPARPARQARRVHRVLAMHSVAVDADSV